MEADDVLAGRNGESAESLKSPLLPEDIAKAVEVLQRVTADDDLWSSKACRFLRRAVAPLAAKLNEKMFAGQAEDDYKKSAKRKRSDATLRNNMKLEDKKLLEKTKLRAGRMHKLNELTKLNTMTDAPLILDGVADDSIDDSDMVAGEQDELSGMADEEGGGEAARSGAPAGAQKKLNYPRACYSCKRRFQQLHHFYDTLCSPGCAELNWTKRKQTADLTGRVALVTGARVKIGFQVCVKLLRAGASVIATTRFPHDAAMRFAELTDFLTWKARLHVFGLDLRDLPSLEAFCAALLTRYSRLDILINNACQTVRRPPTYYAHLMHAEGTHLRALPEHVQDLVEGNAAFQSAKESWFARPGSVGPRMLGDVAGQSGSDVTSEGGAGSGPSLGGVALLGGCGDVVGLAPSVRTMTSAQLSQVPLVLGDEDEDGASFPVGARDVNAQQLDLRRENTWTATLSYVSTPEMAEVMAINAIAPAVLCAKLKPLMMRGTGEGDAPADWRGSGGGGAGGGAALSLAETMLKAQGGGGREGGHTPPEDESEEGGATGGASARDGRRRGGPVGGASKRPRREVQGGAVHGETALHRVPAWRTRYIVNVSSMEGKFYRAKEPAHPHTNMAKAALNMLTRTSAREYAEGFIYMTAVDTGWINDENPLATAARTAARHGFATPLDEVDAAARILDPVLAPLGDAQAEGGDGTCAPMYGAFLKDYFATEW